MPRPSDTRRGRRGLHGFVSRAFLVVPAMADCTRNAQDHCCWIGGIVCQFLEERGGGPFRWTCRLREELGSWDAVHDDLRYLAVVKPALNAADLDMNCGDWPPPGIRCASCGTGGG